MAKPNPLQGAPCTPSWLLRVWVVSGLFFLCWMFRSYAPEGGDTREYLSPEHGYLDDPVILYHSREPGCVWLWQGIYYTVCNPASALFVQERTQAFQLLSCLSGIVFWWFLLSGYACSGKSRGGLPGILPFVLPSALSAATLIFLGGIEFYGPLYAGLLIWWWVLRGHLRDPEHRSFWPVIVTWAILSLLHRVAILYLPALWVARGWKRKEGLFSGWRKSERITLLGSLTVLALSHVVLILFYIHFAGIQVVPVEVDNHPVELLTPWTEGWKKHVNENSLMQNLHRFRLGTPDHLKHYGFFLLLGAPIGIPVCLIFRKRIQGIEKRFLATVALIGWIWAFFWHPHMGYRDWDLFCHPGVATNLLAGLLLLDVFGKKPCVPDPVNIEETLPGV